MIYIVRGHHSLSRPGRFRYFLTSFPSQRTFSYLNLRQVWSPTPTPDPQTLNNDPFAYDLTEKHLP